MYAFIIKEFRVPGALFRNRVLGARYPVFLYILMNINATTSHPYTNP